MNDTIQELGCSTPTDSELCKKCKRNSPHDDYEEFKVVSKIMRPDECIGYINKSQGALQWDSDTAMGAV